jgi:PhnB protein
LAEVCRQQFYSQSIQEEKTMSLTTHLAFSGDCQTAFDMYARVLRGKITFKMTNGESPMADQLGPELKDKIMHIALQTPDGAVLQGADHPQGRPVKPSGFSVCVSLKDAAEAERIFKGLSDGAQVQMEFQKTFWSPGFGMLIDKFGIPWMVNTEGQMPAQG